MYGRTVHLAAAQYTQSLWTSQLLLPLALPTSGNYCSISKSQRGSRSAAPSPGGLASSLTFSRFSEIVQGGEVTLRRMLSEASTED
ncbi:hypothetical protein INR49_013745 [Caranx melampygus]|nr:hypothetical protein INR49_013745 [Caranx melampygus]